MARTTGSPLGSQAQHERASSLWERGDEEESVYGLVVVEADNIRHSHISADSAL